MARDEFERIVDCYDREGYMHNNDIDKLIELAAKGLNCCEGECSEDQECCNK